MRVRTLFRTHYQVDQPGHFIMLVKCCTSPTKSDYLERVAGRLAKCAKFNESAANYAVELSRHAELLTDNMVWTPLGMLLGLVSRPKAEMEAAEYQLTLIERLAMFRVFLESDGACLLWLAQRLLQYEVIPATEEGANRVSREMFLDIYGRYLDIMQAPSERQRVRGERERLIRDGFSGKTGKHKLWLHMEVLNHSRLCDRTDEEGARTYVARQESHLAALRALQAEVPSVAVLERRASAGELVDVACDVLAPTLGLSLGPAVDEAELIARLSGVAGRIVALGYNLCPISTLVDAVRVEATVECRSTPRAAAIRDVIQLMHKRDPRRVRFHVDRSGRPAYVIFEA